ncbi:MAG: beta-galactosidase [Verrucomicrobiae bacterium]|nr:beta-galactosidase [Verrucomicrobiae bacterium]
MRLKFQLGKIAGIPAGLNTPAVLNLVILLVATAAGRAVETPRPFPHPDRIHYDRQCLTIDGRDVFIYSGAFHYFRCPKALWPDRFQKIKDAGFNCVETYVPWNWCERQMPANIDDFSKVDLTEADDFLKMAENYGLYVIVRPGPYICAEWDTGGFPQWLLKKQPADGTDGNHWLRSDDPAYLAWCKHWYDAVCPVIAKHQITRKAPGQPGVILVQLENEYDFAHFSDEVKLNQIRVLGQTAQADGIDVPLITCWTAQVRGQTDPLMRQIFDCCNFYPRWDVDGIRKDIEKLRREQPDAPLATTELQGGWFSKVGEKLSEDQDGVTASQINNLTLFAIQNGDTILNYYMLFGGTNPDDRAARDLTTTYDYNAPIREWGGIGDRYQRVWALGRMLQEHGARLARSEAVKCDANVPQTDVMVAMRRTVDGGRYLFIRTSQHDEPRKGTASVTEAGRSTQAIVFDYDLEPFGSKILYLPPGVNDAVQGEWLPKPAPAIERPSELPPPVSITSAVSRDDPGPRHWQKVRAGENLAAAGIYDSRFLFYRTTISTTVATNLLVEFPDGDAVLAEVNGEPVMRMGGTAGGSVFPLPAGKCHVVLLYENRGHGNGAPGMGEPCGILAARLTGGKFGAGQPVAGWRMQLVDGTSAGPEVKPGFDDAGWKSVVVNSEDATQLTPNQVGVFRTGIDLSAADANGANAVLKFARIDDRGWIFVNGENIGQATDWSRAWAFDITKHLHPGHNVIAVVVQNDGGGGGIGLPELAVTSGGAAVALESFGRPAGDEQKWWAPEMNERGWNPMNIGELASIPPKDPLLTWYRMKFSSPLPRGGVWVPWRLHLVATGNGFLYINGHAIGRYWQAGPQHDFFLPECWLHFGVGQTNLVTLSLRPVDGNTAIQSVTVEPYSDFAEKR